MDIFLHILAFHVPFYLAFYLTMSDILFAMPICILSGWRGRVRVAVFEASAQAGDDTLVRSRRASREGAGGSRPADKI